MSQCLYTFSTFDKQCSLLIKGIAIILMVCHHMWGFKDLNDFSGVWSNLAPYLLALGKAGKVCVAIFTFISGYGLYLSFLHNNKYTNILKKFKNVLFHFWRTVIPILIIFFIVGIIPFNIREFIQNMLCINNSYNGAWWYLQTYLIFLAVSPLIFKLMQNNILSIVLCVLSMTLFRYFAYCFSGEEMWIHFFLYYFPFFILGAVFLKYNLFTRMALKNGRLSFLFYLLLVFLCLVIRMKTGCSEILYILIPSFIFIFLQKSILILCF